MCAFYVLLRPAGRSPQQVPLPLACKQLVTPELMRLVAAQTSARQLRKPVVPQWENHRKTKGKCWLFKGFNGV